MTLAFTVEGEPLGVNRLYRVFNGRSIKSKEGREYHAHFVQRAAIARVGAGCVSAIEGPVAVALRLYFGSERPDVDGPIKIALDAMEIPRPKRDGAGVYRNDRQVRKLTVERFTDRERPRIEVEVSEMPAAAEAQDALAASRRQQKRITASANGLRSSVRSYR